MKRRHFLLGLPSLASAQQNLAIACGQSGGVALPVGGAIAAILSKHVPGIQATAEVTAGAVDSTKLVAAGRSALGTVPAPMVWDAIEGKLRGYPQKSPLRALLALYTDYFQVIVHKNSGIRSIPELRGRRVSLGAAGSGVEVSALRIFAAYGITPADLKRPDRLGHAEGANAFKDRKLDAFAVFAGVPTPAVADAAATPGIALDILPTAGAHDKMAEPQRSLYPKGIIAKGSYKGLDHDVPVVLNRQTLSVRADMPENLAYQITRAVLQHLPDIVAVHKPAREITPASAASLALIPYHPGALRYYRETGILR